DEQYGYLIAELNSCNRARKCFYKLSDDDAAAYGEIVEARKLPKTNEEETKIRASAMQKAFHRATLVPLDVMKLSCDVLHRAENRILRNVSKYVVSDCEIGISLLKTAITHSVKNVYANTVYIRDEKLKAQLENQAKTVLAQI
ncbi:MAG: cyclodeaminase/cyclohydrolase family protein, partial [Firmicutes bacterium]|nr:cyclodeaminase/cyclohydrolase family protein [Bacillota bacterium]